MNYYSYTAEDTEDRDFGVDTRLWSKKEDAITAMLVEVNEIAADFGEKVYTREDVKNDEIEMGFMTYSICTYEVQS